MNIDKNWLIRTKSNHILGPVSKEKVQELYRNGSIKPDDEVCSGNGFWFFIREEDMVASFLLGDEVQGYNPVSEAKDVLTTSNRIVPESPAKDDVTVVGGITLAMLASESKNTEPVTDIPHLTEEEEAPPAPAHENVPEPKKKIKHNRIAKSSASAPKHKGHTPKQQNWMKWVGIVGFVILLALIYYRKTIIRRLFQGEMTGVSFSLINEVHAQEVLPEKKKLLDRIITLDEVNFQPEVGLSGFKVTSTFNINDLSCEELSNEVNQLAVILHPPDLINENFLIKIRQCVLKMSEDHSLKRWLKSLGQVEKRDKSDDEKAVFLTEILNSRFNLITDALVRTRIINHLVDVPETTLGERLLKSYLYLIIGNITKSDNLLQDFIKIPPYQNWKGFKSRNSLYQRLANENTEQIIVKLANHPTDRRVFQLLAQYINNFYRNEALVTILNDNQGSGLDEKLELKYVERIAPEFVHHLRLQKESEAIRVSKLRNVKDYPLVEQAYWHWPFLEINPLISEDLTEELERIEKTDMLWFIYLMDNEKLIDAYARKSGRSFMPGRRQYLRTIMDEPENFMLALFKLIEFGDIDQQLVKKTIDFLTHE